MMGGGGSKEPVTKVLSSREIIGQWSAQREAWWTSIAFSFKNIMGIGDAITTCYTMLEACWSVRLAGLRFLSEFTLRH